MALTDESTGIPATMLVGPASYPQMNGFGSNSGFGGDWAWIILLLLLGWGNNGWGNGFGGGNVGGEIYPWMNQANLTSNGFQNQLLNDNITSIRDGVHSLSNQLCNCCGDMQMALANGFAGVEQGANARQIANMQTAFAGQTAMAQGFNSLLGSAADLKYTVATENCADRAALSDGIRDVIASQTASTQRILDQLCQDKIDAKNDTIAQLRQELLYARGQASQDVQTATLRAGQIAEVDALYDRLNSCPVATVPVYGRQPIFTCGNNGCGCGCGSVM